VLAKINTTPFALLRPISQSPVIQFSLESTFRNCLRGEDTLRAAVGNFIFKDVFQNLNAKKPFWRHPLKFSFSAKLRP